MAPLGTELMIAFVTLRSSRAGDSGPLLRRQSESTASGRREGESSCARSTRERASRRIQGSRNGVKAHISQRQPIVRGPRCTQPAEGRRATSRAVASRRTRPRRHGYRSARERGSPSETPAAATKQQPCGWCVKPTPRSDLMPPNPWGSTSGTDTVNGGHATSRRGGDDRRWQQSRPCSIQLALASPRVAPSSARNRTLRVVAICPRVLWSVGERDRRGVLVSVPSWC